MNKEVERSIDVFDDFDLLDEVEEFLEMEEKQLERHNKELDEMLDGDTFIDETAERVQKKQVNRSLTKALANNKTKNVVQGRNKEIVALSELDTDVYVPIALELLKDYEQRLSENMGNEFANKPSQRNALTSVYSMILRQARNYDPMDVNEQVLFFRLYNDFGKVKPYYESIDKDEFFDYAESKGIKRIKEVDISKDVIVPTLDKKQSKKELVAAIKTILDAQKDDVYIKIDGDEIEFMRRVELTPYQLKMKPYGDSAHDILVNSYTLFAIAHIRERRMYSQTMDNNDLIQEAMIGIDLVLDKYDPGRGFKLVTLMSAYIHQSVMDSINKNGRTIKLPANIFAQISRLSKAEEFLNKRYGDDNWNDEQLLTEANRDYLDRPVQIIKPHHLEIIRTKTGEALSLDKEYTDTSKDGSDSSLETYVVDEDQRTPEESSYTSELNRKLRRIMDEELTEDEINFLDESIGMYNEKKTQKDITDDRGLDRKGFHAKRKEIFNKLKPRIAQEGLEDFLEHIR